MNIGVFRPYGSLAAGSKNLPNIMRRNKIYQLAASNIFMAWGEVLANKLEIILDNQQKQELVDFSHLSPEDFYDEGKDFILNLELRKHIEH
jgi:hypothetical protein